MLTTEQFILKFLAPVKKDFAAAMSSKNAALYLYEAGTRNTIFKLEAFCRLLEKSRESEKFGKWKDRFKLVEDSLGKIDHLAVNIKAAEKSNTKLTANNKPKLALQQAITELNNTLEDKNWAKNGFQKFEKLIAETNRKIDTTFTKWLTLNITKEIESLQVFIKSIDGKFTLVEEHVHEYRRKIRWISIYVQCFPGVFYYTKPRTMPAWAKKYATAEIVKSPHNKLAPKAKTGTSIALPYYNFVAISCVIQNIGKLKDQGLNAHFLETEYGIKNPKATVDQAKLLQQANTLVTAFHKTNVLSTLFS